MGARAVGGQMQLSLRPAWERCEHRQCFYTHAYVPGGIFCADCETLLNQSVPAPPEAVGYLTADWKWKLDGKPWTTQEVWR